MPKNYILAACAAFIGLLMVVFSDGPYGGRTRRFLFLAGFGIVVVSMTAMFYIVRPL